MKQMTKILIAAGLILSLFTLGCNKNNRPPALPDSISGAIILAWNETAFQTMGGSANEHSLLGSRIYAIVHAAMHDAVNATQPRFEIYAFEGKDTAQSSKNYLTRVLITLM